MASQSEFIQRARFNHSRRLIIQPLNTIRHKKSWKLRWPKKQKLIWRSYGSRRRKSYTLACCRLLTILTVYRVTMGIVQHTQPSNTTIIQRHNIFIWIKLIHHTHLTFMKMWIAVALRTHMYHTLHRELRYKLSRRHATQHQVSLEG